MADESRISRRWRQQGLFRHSDGHDRHGSRNHVIHINDQSKRWWTDIAQVEDERSDSTVHACGGTLLVTVLTYLVASPSSACSTTIQSYQVQKSIPSLTWKPELRRA
jgi:hypothetical protein